MKIISVINDSFQEYEGYHSLVLFCAGCNFRCSYCYNLNHILGDDSIGNFYDVLQSKITPMHDAVVILGGEPTIWNDDLVDAIKMSLKRKLKVKVYTNGHHPGIIAKIVDAGVSALSIDLKCVRDCSKTIGINISDNDYVSSVSSSIAIANNGIVDVEVRTTDADGIDVESVIEYMKKRFPLIRHIVQKDFRPMAIS